MVTGFVEAQLLDNYVILEIIIRYRAGWRLAMPSQFLFCRGGASDGEIL